MQRFLTIDWDYLVNATANYRLWNFPDTPNENYPPDLQTVIWQGRYISTPHPVKGLPLKNIEVTADMLPLADFVKNILNYCKNELYVSDSHKHMYNVVRENYLKTDEPFEVINFDFHHDLYTYHTGDERVNCGNWGSMLFEDFPHMKYTWIGHSDSEREVLGGVDVTTQYPNMRIATSIDELTGDISPEDLEKYFKSFVAVHVCKSSMWSPPHLDNKFTEFIKHCVSGNTGNCIYLEPATIPRKLAIDLDNLYT